MFALAIFLPTNIRIWFLISCLISISAAQITPSPNYTYPIMYHDSNATFSTSTANVSIVKDFQVTENYIAQLSIAGELNIWWIENKILLLNLNPSSFLN
jgi:hypothetical protein